MIDKLIDKFLMFFKKYRDLKEENEKLLNSIKYNAIIECHDYVLINETLDKIRENIQILQDINNK
jgi:hypothetical protein